MANYMKLNAVLFLSVTPVTHETDVKIVTRMKQQSGGITFFVTCKVIKSFTFRWKFEKSNNKTEKKKNIMPLEDI